MNAGRFSAIAKRYPGLRIAVVGDFFLDRYLLIDPSRVETSIETGLPVHNVVEVRAEVVVRDLGEMAPAERVDLRPEGFRVERGFLDRLEDDPVPIPAHPHLLAGQTKFLGQANRLAAAMHEDLGYRGHGAGIFQQRYLS